MPKRKAKQNIYTHTIELKNLNIVNTNPKDFRQTLENIEYRGYEVETLSDGKKIVITKPGGKFVFGTVKREDFMVWVYNPSGSTLWLISHKNIYEDLEKKGEVNPAATIRIIDALERVYKGEEPNEILSQGALENPVGETAELLLKAYKWIWGQEDVNYPDGKGRAMSWEGLKKDDRGEWISTGEGIVDLRMRLSEKI